MAVRADWKALLAATSLTLGLTLGVTLGLTSTWGSAPALAQSSCEGDMSKLQEKRMGLLESITKLQDKEEGKLDPVAACPKLRSLASLEKDIQTYMEKNQSWCNIPDEALTNIKETQSKTTKIAGQACSIAAQIKKQQQQQAQGGIPTFNAPSPKLPGGPL